jgi:exonuclease VII small subunit
MADDTLARIDAHMERGNELLARIDEHLERGIADFSPEHLERGSEFAARLEAHLARCEQVIAASGTSYDDWRFALRQDSLRNERILGEISQSLARNSLSLERHTASLERHTASLERHTDEVIAEQRAQREALWRMLDKLDGRDGPEPSPG